MGKLGKCRFLLIPLLVITFALLFLFDTKPVKAGSNHCTTTSDCDWHCDNTPHCTDRCVGYNPGPPEHRGDCAWTIGNTCPADGCKDTRIAEGCQLRCGNSHYMSLRAHFASALCERTLRSNLLAKTGGCFSKTRNDILMRVYNKFKSPANEVMLCAPFFAL